MKYKAVLPLLLRNLQYIFLNGFHMFAHQLLRLVPVSGNNGFHQLLCWSSTSRAELCFCII